MSRDGWDDWYRNREKRRHAVKPSAGKVAAAIEFYRPAGTPAVAIGDLTVIDEGQARGRDASCAPSMKTTARKDVMCPQCGKIFDPEADPL